MKRTKPGEMAPSECARIGGVVATFEVGNAAAPDVRAAAVAKQTAACESANLTPSEIACIGRATDTWAIKGCAPRMFPAALPGPAPATAGSADCREVVTRIRAAVIADLKPGTGSAGTTMVDKMIAIMERACVEDQWPESMRRCVVAATTSNAAAVQACNESMPKDLQDKLAKRMAAEMPKVADPK